MHINRWSLLIFGSVLFIMVIKPLNSVSAACPFPSITTPTNIGATDCTVDSGTYTGVDVASGANNVAVLILNNAASHVTVNAGGHLLVGSIQITGIGAYISIQPAANPYASGEIKPNAVLYITDADSDGYPLNLTLSDSSTGKRRLSLMTSLTILDCLDTDVNKYANAVCYADADGDTYTTGGPSSVCGTSTTCNGTTWKAAANGADCKDTGAYAAYVMFSGLTCYYDSDNDNYGQNTARTCMNTQSCATATWGTTGAADDAGNINFSSVNTDCNDGDGNVFTAHAQCYQNIDRDPETLGLRTNTTCLNSASCNTATWASGSTGTATSYVAGQIVDAAAGSNADCNDNDGSYYHGNGSWYSDANDHNCSGGIDYQYGVINCTTCDPGNGHSGRYDENGGLDGNPACGGSANNYISLHWGCYDSTTCPNQFSAAVTQGCH